MKNKRVFIYIAFGVLLYVVLTHLTAIWNMFLSFLSVISPIIMGCVFAFILNAPIKLIEKKIKGIKRTKKKELKDKIIHIVSLVLALIILFGLISLTEFSRESPCF